ncbi:hypothetical protein [Emcibacter sp.]|uniref:hypothetical protein n=1 Tax=Emcibacter sp. TaxID=1979954 RepID=UPI003A925EFD
MPKRPPFLPEEIANIHKLCDSCGKIVRPNFWSEFDGPFIPIYPDGTKGEKGAFIQISATTSCGCGAKTSFDIEAKRLKHFIHFYGDEAERQVRNYDLLVYSLIGGTSGQIQQIEEDVRALKCEVLPDIDPESWRIHTTEMMDSKKRIQHGVYKHISSKKIIPFFEGCTNIFRKNEEFSWNICSIGFLKSPSNKRKRRTYLKDGRITVHQALLSYAIHRSTKKELRPMFTLDASRPIINDPHLEGWSYDTYNGSRCFLANAFLSHSNDINAPNFVAPGSHPCLELADVHAYFAARNLAKRTTKQRAEISLKEFGKFSYLIMLDNNSMDYLTGDDIPNKYIPS